MTDHTQTSRDARLTGYLHRPEVRSALRANAAQMRRTKAAVARLLPREGLDARTVVLVIDRPLESRSTLRSLLDAETVDETAVEAALVELRPAIARHLDRHP